LPIHSNDHGVPFPSQTVSLLLWHFQSSCSAGITDPPSTFWPTYFVCKKFDTISKRIIFSFLLKRGWLSFSVSLFWIHCTDLFNTNMLTIESVSDNLKESKVQSLYHAICRWKSEIFYIKCWSISNHLVNKWPRTRYPSINFKTSNSFLKSKHQFCTALMQRLRYE
jgi:hypothetical protein